MNFTLSYIIDRNARRSTLVRLKRTVEKMRGAIL